MLPATVLVLLLRNYWQTNPTPVKNSYQLLRIGEYLQNHCWINLHFEYLESYGPHFSWSCPSNWLSKISNELIRVLGPRGSSWPIKELFLKSRTSSLVLFSSNQLGKLPIKLLCERSTPSNLNWYWRKPGRSPVSLQLDGVRPLNWNKGTQPTGYSVSTSNLLLSLPSMTTLSLEWLEKELKENEPSNWLQLRLMYYRDVRLDNRGEETFPGKRL